MFPCVSGQVGVGFGSRPVGCVRRSGLGLARRPFAFLFPCLSAFARSGLGVLALVFALFSPLLHFPSCVPDTQVAISFSCSCHCHLPFTGPAAAGRGCVCVYHVNRCKTSTFCRGPLGNIAAMFL